MTVTAELDVSNLVAKYVKLRDLIKSKDDEHKASMKPYRETLEQLNTVLLGHLLDIKAESVKTSSGTVYVTSKKSATLADADAFMRHVIENNDWDLLDRKANSTAVADYIDDHGTPPPGVNFNTRNEVGVRRS